MIRKLPLFQQQLKYCHFTFYMCSCMELTFYMLYDLHSFWIPACIVFHHIMVDSRSSLLSLQHLFSHVPLSSWPPSPPIKAKWTPREPLALYCPSSMTPMWPEERNIVLILPDMGSGRSLLLVRWLKISFLHLFSALSLFAVDFLAKYCIFSQEKLAEYRRAFEEVSVRENHLNSCSWSFLLAQH